MKFITAVALFALMLTSCVTKESNYALINGQFIGEKEGKEIHLCKVEHGETAKVAVTTISADGRFGFNYPVDKAGLYVLNVVWDKALRSVKKDHDLKRLYLEDGVELDVKISDGTYELLASNSVKNDVLSEWNTKVDTVFSYSHGFSYNMADYTSFFPLLPKYVDETAAFKAKINTGDANFDELMKLLVETDMNASALTFIYTPRGKHPERKDYAEYYETLLNEKSPQSARLLELPNGYDYVRLYSMFAVMSLPDKPTDWNKAAMENIPNDLLKGYYALNNVSKFRTYDDAYVAYKAMVEPFLSTPYLKDELKAFEMTIRDFEKGSPAFDFAGKDVNGKEHKLSDYKGNLVYIDVWATWCGPCKSQIPALKELEKKYHGQPVTFLSISVDKMKDQQKWKDFVKEENLQGVQLMADKAFASDVAEAYRINAIPRFMLIDMDGNIVSTDAPRPSDEKANELIKKYL
ncbi:TlpA disulfide reductase family protein [Carboxylicivirga sp. M1479]|uniref:TlpA family protein disulfide reductase n=1 Tax=Carboxylicivirga sp. M1479 TaxID=2594476 RepID=UPI0011773649|nr:TlpA disulfide reductase family protein [Carboxylicivirga sp. M1479]TRX72111.1 TlpA family protein disulfide reductase [Carboxylicivirga sp. M1479]